MDLNQLRSLPPAGHLRLANDGGVIVMLDPNGRRSRLRPEAGTPVNASKATTTLTLTGRAHAGETIYVGGVTYTWRAAPTMPNEVKIGASTAAHDVLALVAAINASASTTLYGAGTIANPQFSGADGDGDTVVCTALLAGVFGNSATTTTMTNANWTGTAASGGIDATLGSHGDQLFDSSYRYTAVVDAVAHSESAWYRSALEPVVASH